MTVTTKDPRVKHQVLYTGSSFYHRNLAKACEEAEENKMILRAILDAKGGSVILVFIGLEADILNEGDEADG